MSSTINLDVSYSQLAVFASALTNPFNDWADKHVAQGFAWRPGSVSFRTLVEAGQHCIEIEIADHVGPLDSHAVRVIEVPFEVPDDGAIEVGSISDSLTLSVPPGIYLLRCEFCGPIGTTDEFVHLVFAKKDFPRFAVVRADESLSIRPRAANNGGASPWMKSRS